MRVYDPFKVICSQDEYSSKWKIDGGVAKLFDEISELIVTTNASTLEIPFDTNSKPNRKTSPISNVSAGRLNSV